MEWLSLSHLEGKDHQDCIFYRLSGKVLVRIEFVGYLRGGPKRTYIDTIIPQSINPIYCICAFHCVGINLFGYDPEL